jgi:hypothetical protein
MKNEKLEYKFPSPYFPDWDEVSDIYKYRAFDANGDLFYYINEPKQIGLTWSTLSDDDCDYGGTASTKWAEKIWRDSLEKRPE